MEEVSHRPKLEYISPPLPPKVRQKISSGTTTFTQISSFGDTKVNLIDDANSGDVRSKAASNDYIESSMHSLVLNSSPPATVFVADNRTKRDTSEGSLEVNTPSDDTRKSHVVTIRINTDTNPKPIGPIISSVHLKSDNNYQTFSDIYNTNKKNNSLVTLNADDKQDDSEEEGHKQHEKNAPYIFCSSYLNSSNMVLSSGQCSPSDTLDSGTCSDLDGTPPPLPKKKLSKTNPHKKSVTVTLIGTENLDNHADIDYEDNDSNISCDSLNSSELNGSVHSENSENKKDRNRTEPPLAPTMPVFVAAKVKENFLPQGLLQDIRERSTKLNSIESENKTDSWHEPNETLGVNLNENQRLAESKLNSIRLVSAISKSQLKPTGDKYKPIVNESTYEERQKQNKKSDEKICYSSNFVYDTDKYYEFHLNEKVFPETKCKSVQNGVKSECVEDESLNYFAGIKDFKSDDGQSTIRSSKGTIRGVKNRVRAGIATFLQMQNKAVKSYKEKDAGKVVLYTTTMGIVRSTYQRCVLVKKILRNLLVKFEERDVFMSTEYQDEIRDRMQSDDILVPQLFVDGHHIGDADTVEKLNESGELRKMLKQYKSADACSTCQVCGGFRLLPCRVCSGSKKSLHRNHFTAEFVALKCMNCDEVGLVKCEACS